MKCLMLGSGFTPPIRKLFLPGSGGPDTDSEGKAIEWTKLDMNPDSNPDILMNLDRIEVWQVDDETCHIPRPDNTFDEIHAYSVMEHYGKQGDFKGFFCGMRELWRILKPGGLLIAGTPLWNDLWAWSDPGHTRVISRGTLAYLTKKHYEEGLGTTPSSDYRRFVSPCWWEILHTDEDYERCGYYFALKKVTCE